MFDREHELHPNEMQSSADFRVAGFSKYVLAVGGSWALGRLPSNGIRGDVGMKIHNQNESGQSLVLIMVSLTVLIGFLGLAIDVGTLYRTKQNAQIAADAAAVAATMDYMYTASVSSAQAAGKAASKANGYENGVNGVTVAVNMPPTSGPNQTIKFAEAIVTKTKTMSFAALVKHSSMLVAARAVAGTPVYGNACIWLMAATGQGLAVQGSYDINIANCGIYVNSPSSTAVGVTGNGGSLTAKFVDTTGNVTPQHQTTPTPITKNTAPRKNPFGSLSGINPNTGPCSITSAATSITTATTGATAQSAVQGSATNNVVCFTNAVTFGNGVSLPGADQGVTYVFAHGLTVATGATVTFGSSTYNSTNNTFSGTSGATIDLYGGTLNQQSNSALNVYAPTAGTYNGIGILQPTTNTTTPLQIQFGSNGETFDGYVYAPGTTVYMQDSGGTGVKDMGIVALGMSVQTAYFHISSYDAANAQTTPVVIISLVE
jgi:hypothetical protein